MDDNAVRHHPVLLSLHLSSLSASELHAKWWNSAVLTEVTHHRAFLPRHISKCNRSQGSSSRSSSLYICLSCIIASLLVSISNTFYLEISATRYPPSTSSFQLRIISHSSVAPASQPITRPTSQSSMLHHHITTSIWVPSQSRNERGKKRRTEAEHLNPQRCQKRGLTKPQSEYRRPESSLEASCAIG
jgi:hypothetical protein